MGKKKNREDRSQTYQQIPFNNPFTSLSNLVGEREAAVLTPENTGLEAPLVVAEAPRDTLGSALATLLSRSPKLVVRKEKKGRGGKTVTKVEGVDGDSAELVQMARTMAKALGCGVSVEDGALLAQGGQSPRVAQWLKEQGARKVVIGDSLPGARQSKNRST